MTPLSFLRKRALWLLLFLLLFWPRPPAAVAHPADMYTQTYALRLTPTAVQLTYTLSPGPLLAASTWYEADGDGDDAVSAEEATAWLAPLLANWQSALGGVALDWQLTAVAWPASLREFELGDAVITAELRASLPTAAPEFSFYNPYAEALSINWFYVYGTEGVTFTRPQQENGRLNLTLTFPDQPAAPLRYWDSGTPALSPGALPASKSEPAAAWQSAAAVPAPGSAPPPQDTRPYVRLTSLLRNPQLTPLFLATALGLALALGGMHALTPGHGKALVAAYLVGARGSARHAAALGGVVTLTHTGSVLAVGLVTLLASRYLVPTALFPVLEIVSGLLITAMGVMLLWQRWRGWRGVQQKRQRQARQERQSPVANSQPSLSSSRQRIPIGAEIATRPFDAALQAESGALRWRALVGLGISGGLVPCPDAIAILLVAVALNRLTLGLSMIVSFSLGLAAVLIAIGLAMVQSRQLLARFGRVERHAPTIALLSAAIVLGLGLGLTWNAVRGTGYLAQSRAETAVAASTRPRPTFKLPKPLSSFSLQEARVLYVVLDDLGMYQLHSVSAAGTEEMPVALTQAPNGIWNFTVSPDGRTVVYAALRADRGSDLWLWQANGRHELLLECPTAACRNATFAPDGMRLVYERLDTSPDNVAATSTLWWLDMASGETAPLFQDATLPGFAPAWSPDGQWLSYIAPAMPTKIQLYNLADGRSHEFPTLTSMSVVWSPDGRSLLLTDVNRATLREGAQALTHLLRFDVAGAQLSDISQQETVSDSWPAWSPDGQWVAFVRRIFSNGQPERGNQIWLMRADGSEARALTQTNSLLHQGISWSPDGRYLLYHRYDLETPLARPTIWLLEVESGAARELVSPGSQPAWLWGTP